jgi:hypothetical protein
MTLHDGVLERGLTDAIKDNDTQFPPDFRLSRSGRAHPAHPAPPADPAVPAEPPQSDGERPV